MKRKQDPPFSIQIEPTEGCNLYCEFCGLRGIRTKEEKNYKFMTVRTAKMIAEDIRNSGWTSRIEFAMHGEPTMNPNLIDIISVFRSKLSNQLMITSNGGGLLNNTLEKIDSLFEAGLNILALDEYENVNIVSKIRSKLEGLKNYTQHSYPEEPFSPHNRYPKSTKMIVYVKDIVTAEKGGHSVLNNHCGGAFPLDTENSYGRCAKPFRELSVRWNGRVSLCCNDFRGVFKAGDVHSTPLETIWNSKEFNSARKFLYHGQRIFNPCQGCTAKSYRVGLLPDKFGKQTLPKPTNLDFSIVTEASKGRSYTPIIKREWEK